MAAYKLNEEAEEDLVRLYEHGVLSFGLDQADRYSDGLIERFCELADSPHLWQAVDYIRTGYRRSVYASHSNYYRICGDSVETMRILGKQDPKNELE